ncbi:hypothetical protein JOF56_011095 [Kibdelosporangium banguiense]|uniref:DUF5666 domain-containing protein n=1 Tax=Kibdelosporangium banguiense TaxID=1365924 RepID=A0ABS4U3G8_9PSEU|nr:hypothetical protein [Kibdelosporangium banguiense]MBP2330710.1 hypothetical protein [Kibdelosporangium banguiense]
MTQPHHDPADQELTWGGRQPEPKKRWSGKKTAAAVAIAVGVAAAGGVAVYAATGSAGAATSQQAMGGGMGGPGGGGMRGGGMMDALHGEFTISDGNGGYKTAIMQTGEVTAVSDTSLTAKSADGYTKVYTIDKETLFGNASASDIQTGDTVMVVATPSGDNATADSVMERGQGGTGGQMQGGGPGGGQGGARSEQGGN